MRVSLSHISVIGFLFFSAYANAQPNIQVRQFKLDNGLTVILNEDHLKPEIFGVVVVKAGSKNDPSDATGLAHYQEHMLFKGTDELGTTNWQEEKPHIDKIFALYDKLAVTKDEKERNEIQSQINEESLLANEYAIPNELSNIIKSSGGTKLNANTSPDRTVYFNAFPSNQIEKWLEIYSHRFINPVFRGFQSELEVVYEEKNRYADMFQIALLEEFNKQAFKNHPYGQQTALGTVDHLKNPSLTKMYVFFKTYYVANNMALVLSGDFNTEEIIPVIREKFGRLKSGEILPNPEYIEAPFKGRELIEKRLSPIKIAILGFRTVPNGHPDKTALEVCNGILSNSNETGLLDKLSIDNKLMGAVLVPMSYNDQGMAVFIVIPKIVGQKLQTAEQMVLAELEKPGKGEFDDSMLEAVKNQLYIKFETNMESVANKAIYLAELFGKNEDMKEINEYSEEVRKITREDVIRVANKYYGKNYLAFYSKMGSPKKIKIDKPDYKPVLKNGDAKSEYVKMFDQIKVKEPLVKYIDFEKDIFTAKLQTGVDFYSVNNPLNDIFSLKIKFGIGNQKMLKLNYAAQIINYSGVKGKGVSDYKNEFAKIGCTYGISSDNSYLMVSLEGLEANMPQALKLINELFTSPELDKEKLKILIEGEKASRKMERSDPDNVADAIFQYVQFGNMSSYLNRLTMKGIEALNADSLVSLFQKALTYECEIHYTGKSAPKEVMSVIEKSISFSPNPLKSESPVVLESIQYNEGQVFLVEKKKAVQSKVYLFANGQDYSITQQPYIDAFNLYFGGDFSGLVLQEIREYRSLAYTAGAKFKVPELKGKPVNFAGYVGTQTDKTLEALTVFAGLIHTMPEKSDRLELIKQYVSLSALTDRPNFRELSETKVKWRQQGYIDDPLKVNMPKYRNLTFDEIITFYRQNLQNKAVVYSLVSDPKKININELGKFGKVTKVKEKSLFK